MPPKTRKQSGDINPDVVFPLLDKFQHPTMLPTIKSVIGVLQSKTAGGKAQTSHDDAVREVASGSMTLSTASPFMQLSKGLERYGKYFERVGKDSMLGGILDQQLMPTLILWLMQTSFLTLGLVLSRLRT